MSNTPGPTRWLIRALFVVVIVAATAYLIEFVKPKGPGGRPIGTAADIETLRERKDLNVLFILIDTLRSDRLGSYGYERNTSPVLDRIAAEGARFAHHLSQSSWTKCSMASLWTSRYPARTGVTRFGDVVPDSAEMPAEILREAGFQTVGIYRNGWVSNTFGFSQGFDVYQRPAPSGLPPNVKRQNPTLTEQSTDNDAVAAAVEFLRINGRDRWFLYVHLMDLHEYVYDADSALFGTAYSDVYDNSIRWTDTTIALLFDYLEAEGYLDDTLVVITSDHGEAFRERGFEGHARKVYRETTEVPLILSFPFELEEGVVVEARSRGVDVWPTVLDLIGLEPPDDLDGRSLVPLMLASARGEDVTSGDRTIGISHLDQDWGQRGLPARPTVAVTEGPLRFVRVEQPGGAIEQLYDRSVDPLETQDISAQAPEVAERLGAIATEYLEQEPSWGKAPTKELNELELNHLRALGYALP